MTTIDSRLILRELNDAERACIESLASFAELDSTSSRLMNEAPPAPGRCRIVIADRQTAGRGRRDNQWESPGSAGLWLSLAHTFRDTPQQLPSLTLAVGAGIADALRRLGVEVFLKWPNDLIAGDAKLGGILTEIQFRGTQARSVVVGVGINTDLPAAVTERIERARGARVTDLKSCLGVLPPRTELAALVIGALIASIARFVDGDLEAALGTWQRYDWLAGKRISVEENGRRLTGIAGGIDAGGALLLRAHGRTVRIVSGSVELHDAAEARA